MSYVQPVFPALLLVTLISALAVRWKYRNRVLIPASLLLFLYCWAPVSWLALRPFESRYSMEPPRDKNVQAIVVLSSSVFPPFPPRPTAILGNDTYERCQYAAWLHKHWLSVPVLASGGGPKPVTAYSLTMSEALQREGVPASMIWTERQSRSTYENALYSAEILRQKGIHRIVLVTEAYHMLRAEKCFRKQGLDVVPAACGFRSVWLDFQREQILPGWEPIAWNEDTVHEAVGLLWYRLRNRI